MNKNTLKSAMLIAVGIAVALMAMIVFKYGWSSQENKVSAKREEIINAMASLEPHTRLESREHRSGLDKSETYCEFSTMISFSGEGKSEIIEFTNTNQCSTKSWDRSLTNEVWRYNGVESNTPDRNIDKGYVIDINPAKSEIQQVQQGHALALYCDTECFDSRTYGNWSKDKDTYISSDSMASLEKVNGLLAEYIELKIH